MKYVKTPLNDVYLLEIEPFEDQRGIFARLFCQKELKTINQDKTIKQINFSYTRNKGTVRGMHFQYPPRAETKMIKCLQGKVFDVAIDLRKGSKTFLKWHGEILSKDNLKMIYIPEGFAHGFQTLESNCELIYLHTEFYTPNSEGGLCYNDPSIGIKWPLPVQELSEKDNKFKTLSLHFNGINL